MRRITKAKVKFLTLCPRGANRMPAIYKEEDGGFDFRMITKVGDDFAEKGELTAVVYAPELRDSQGEIASGAVIKDMMYDAAKEGLSIDIRHNEKALAKEDAYIAESFIVQKGDPRFADATDYDNNPVDVTGAWAVVLKIEAPDLRAAYREGKWEGISMGGAAASVPDNAAEKVLAKLLQKISNTSPQESQDLGDIDMTGDELTAAIAKGNEPLLTAIAKMANPNAGETDAEKLIRLEKENDLLRKGKTPPKGKDTDDDTDSDEAPVFKGDPTVKNIKAHRLALRKHNAQQKVDWADDKSVDVFQKEMVAIEKEASASDDDSNKDDGKSSEERRLEKELADARKRSNQSDDDDDNNSKTNSDPGYESMTKEEREGAAAGSEMAAWANDNK